MFPEQWSGRKKCVVKMLDFENCVMTVVRNKTSISTRRNRTRAKISRELHSEDEVKEIDVASNCGSMSPVLRSGEVPKGNMVVSDCSPVLLRKTQVISSSPVLTSTKAQRALRPKPTIGAESLASSPRLMVTAVNEMMPSSQLIETQSSPPRKPSQDLFALSASPAPSIDIDSSKEVCLGSSDGVTGSGDSCCLATPSRLVQAPNTLVSHTCDSGTKRKRFKKNSLSARLEKLLKRQRSEHRIRQHEREVLKAPGTGGWTEYHVVDTWREAGRLLVNCKELGSAEGSVVVVLGRQLARGAQLSAGTRLRVLPPWRRVRVELLKTEVVFSVADFQVVPLSDHCSYPSRARRLELGLVPRREYAKDALYLGSSLFSHVNGL